LVRNKYELSDIYKIDNKQIMKHVKLFEAFVASQKVTESTSSGYLKIDIGSMYDLYNQFYALEYVKSRNEKELSFLKSLECAKTPNKAFKEILKELELGSPFYNKELKKQTIKIKQAHKDFKKVEKDPNSKKAMEMMEELSQNIGAAPGSMRPRDIKYRYDYDWKDWDLTPSDKLAYDKFIADILKEYKAESAKAEKMEAEFWKYIDTLELNL
jgi:hypothetical protein